MVHSLCIVNAAGGNHDDDLNKKFDVPDQVTTARGSVTINRGMFGGLNFCCAQPNRTGAGMQRMKMRHVEKTKSHNSTATRLPRIHPCLFLSITGFFFLKLRSPATIPGLVCCSCCVSSLSSSLYFCFYSLRYSSLLHPTAVPSLFCPLFVSFEWRSPSPHFCSPSLSRLSRPSFSLFSVYSPPFFFVVSPPLGRFIGINVLL